MPDPIRRARYFLHRRRDPVWGVSFPKSGRTWTKTLVERYYQEHTVIRHGSDPKHADLGPGREIVVGTFVDEPRPTYLELYENLVVEKNQFQKPLSQPAKES